MQTFLGGLFQVGNGFGEGVTLEDLSIKEFIMREENFHEGGAGFSTSIKKKTMRKLIKKKFFNWK